MNVNISRHATGWKPTTEEWGLAAYEETKVQFVDLVMNSDRPRAQAYALWALSHDPNLAGRELFNFRTGCGNDQPDPEQIEKARHAIKQHQMVAAATTQQKPDPLPAQNPPPPQKPPVAATKPAAPKADADAQAQETRTKESGGQSRSRKGKGLSKMEKAILANFSDASKTIVAYKAAKKALAKAQRDLEKAGEKIRLIDPDKARLLSQLDPQAASVLRDLGVVDCDSAATAATR